MSSPPEKPAVMATTGAIPPPDNPLPTGDTAPESPRATVTTLSTVESKPIRWLWPGRLAKGKIVLLDGDPGVGKSTLALNLAATVSTGGTWPDGEICPVGDVLLLSAEDDLADTIKPRLEAAGADASRIHSLDAVSVHSDDGRPLTRPPTLNDIRQIAEEIRRYQVRLVIVDVLMAYLPPGVDSHRDQDVRQILARLKTAAEETDCCILMLRHLNKSGGGPAIYRGGGSIGISGAARAAFIAARDPDDQDLIVFAPLKSNLSRPAPALAYRLAETDLGVARVKWQGPVDRQADDLLVTESTVDREERDELSAFIRETVIAAGGKIPAKDAKAAIKREFGDVASSKVNRAKKRAGITSDKMPGSMTGGWLWALKDPEGSTEESEDPSTREPDTFGTFVESSGPCNRCGNPTHRYGEGGNPLCGDCQPSNGSQPRAAVY